MAACVFLLHRQQSLQVIVTRMIVTFLHYFAFVYLLSNIETIIFLAIAAGITGYDNTSPRDADLLPFISGNFIVRNILPFDCDSHLTVFIRWYIIYR